MARLLWLLLSGVQAQQSLSATLMDDAFAAIAGASRSGMISTEEELAAVNMILVGYEPFLMMAKHFRESKAFPTHIRRALKYEDATLPVPSQLVSCSLSPTLDPLLMRRSVVAYNSSQVPTETVQRALEAAILAPNHFLTEPWRFYLAGPKTKSDICHLNPAKSSVFEKVPGWLVVTLKSEYEVHSKLYYEDHAATSAAIQNFMLSLASAGVGSKWMTGALGIPPEQILSTLEIDSTEKFMGIIW